MRRQFRIFNVIELLFILMCSLFVTHVCHASTIVVLPPDVADIAGAKDEIILTYNRNSFGRIACCDISNGKIRWTRRMNKSVYANTITSASLAYIPDEFILNIRDGAIQKNFTNIELHEKVALSPGLFVVSRTLDNADQMLVAYDTTHFREVWRSRLRYCRIVKIIPRGNQFEVLTTAPMSVLEGKDIGYKDGVAYASVITSIRYVSSQVVTDDVSWKSPYDGSYRIVTIRASDGRIISNKAFKNFGDLYHGDPMNGEKDTYLPGTLPSAVKSFIRKIFGTLGYPHWPILRTRLERNDKLWFIGKINRKTQKGTVFAFDDETGKTVWKCDVSGLWKILAYKGKLLAASFMADQYGPSTKLKKNKLLALDAKTGKVCWTTVVPD